MNKPIHKAAALVFVLTGAVFGLIALPAMAQEEGIIKYRQSVMKANSAHFSAIAGILKGQVNFTDDLKIHARALADLAKIAAHVFPEGSDFGVTRAKEEIWSKPQEFKKVMMAFQMESAKLATIAEGGDIKAFGAQFKALGKNACGTCHKAFREKKK